LIITARSFLGEGDDQVSADVLDPEWCESLSAATVVIIITGIQFQRAFQRKRTVEHIYAPSQKIRRVQENAVVGLRERAALVYGLASQFHLEHRVRIDIWIPCRNCAVLGAEDKNSGLAWADLEALGV